MSEETTQPRRPRADTEPLLTPRNNAAARAHMNIDGSTSSSDEAEEEDKNTMLAPLNLTQNEIAAKLAAIEEADRYEQKRAARVASANFETQSTSSTNTLPFSDSESDEEDDEQASDSTDKTQRLLHTEAIEKFLNGTSCTYSFTELISSVLAGLNENQREQFWVVQCLMTESKPLPSFDSVLRKTRLPRKTYEQIMLDIYRTLPDVAQKDPFFINSLYRGLVMHAAFRPDIGYVQGMNFLWGIIVLCNSKPHQQLLIAEHVVRVILPYYFTTDFVGAAIDARVLSYYMQRRCTNLEKHMRERFDGSLHAMFLRICSSWFTSMFANHLPRTLAMSLWDLVMMRGAVALFEFTLRLFIYGQKRGWLAKFTDWPAFLTKLEQRMLELTSLEPIYKTHLPNDRIVQEDFVTRRRAATRIVFAEMRATAVNLGK